MIVPHRGQSVHSLRLPIRIVKAGAAALCVCVLALTGAFINYRYTINTANAERSELQQLRQVNNVQHKQIEQLAKTATALQEDMSRLNKLDAEIRRIVSSDELPETSRSGGNRITAPAGGQGGPVVKPQVNEVSNMLQSLQNSVKQREASLSNLRDALLDKQARLAATPSIWPADGEVTSRFGWRSSPWGWGSDWHPGIDIASDYGTPVVAAANGYVSSAGWYGGYGRAVEIDHGNGIVTLYGHNAELVVSVGQYVKKGELIAYMGSSGVSTGPHVHYEVTVNGTRVNPANFL